MTDALLSIADIADGAAALHLDPSGAAQQAVAIVDLDSVRGWDASMVEAAVTAIRAPSKVLLGVTHGPLLPAATRVLAALTCTLAPKSDASEPAPVTCADVEDPLAAAEVLARTAERSPFAALTLDGLLRVTEQVSVIDGLFAESLAYSMLLAGPEFLRWRATTPRRPVEENHDAVLLARDGARLNVVLNRPQRHNAFGRGVRDGLIEAMQLAELDGTIEEVHLSGKGRSFCSGGDLDEFGTTPNAAAAHLIRLHQSAGLAVHRCADRVRATVHGACIGAGIEVPAFAGRIEARADAYFQLPELRMGLVPGAGGTVSITRRIGRWRTAYLALYGQPVDVETALRWGLVDARA